MVSYWKSLIPDSIYEVSYENIINNSDKEIKKLIKFCKLSWSENCLNHHKHSKTPIKTVSFVQARKPIYNKSVNSNINFSNNLNKLFSIIS